MPPLLTLPPGFTKPPTPMRPTETLGTNRTGGQSASAIPTTGEQLANDAQSTLLFAIGPLDETLTLAAGDGDGKRFPIYGPFRVRIDNEIVLVASRSADTLFGCVRGIEYGGTITGPAAHASGAMVTQILTVGGSQQYITDRSAAAVIGDGRGLRDAQTPITRFPKLLGVEGTGVTTAPLVGSQDRFQPMLISTAQTIDEVWIEVTTAVADSAARLGIYGADLEWQPTTLIADFGAVSSATTGIKKIIGLGLLLPAGRYLGVVNPNGAISLRAVTGGNRFSGLVSSLGATPLVQSINNARAYGPFPATGTKWTGASGTTAPFLNMLFFIVTDSK